MPLQPPLQEEITVPNKHHFRLAAALPSNPSGEDFLFQQEWRPIYAR